jgi:acyl carrier protein
LSNATAAQLERTVRRLVGEVLWLPEADLVGSIPLVEFGLDSPMAIELAVSIEDTFRVELPEDVVAQLQTIDDIVRYLGSEVP